MKQHIHHVVSLSNPFTGTTFSSCSAQTMKLHDEHAALVQKHTTCSLCSSMKSLKLHNEHATSIFTKKEKKKNCQHGANVLPMYVLDEA